MKRVCIVTGARSEYGLFYPIIKAITQSKKLELQLVVTTMHLSPEYGETYQEIIKDGFKIDAKIENLLAANTNTAVVKSTGLAMIELANVYERLKPDVVLLLGDRFETHAAATAALLMRIPIAHIHGGEITKGAIDDQMRHAITKMSNLHFVATKEYADRVIQMGEHPKTVIISGAPGIDNMLHEKLLTRSELERDLNWFFGEKNILFTYHAETLTTNNTQREIENILNGIAKLGEEFHVLFTYANADEGGATINRAIEEFVKKDTKRYRVVKSLGRKKYLSAMKVVNLLVGNTSSGIIEAASFCKPVVNIGSRQDGRAQNDNVINVNSSQITSSIDKALTKENKEKCNAIKNIYGNGVAAFSIVKTLEEENLSIKKEFFENASSM